MSPQNSLLCSLVVLLSMGVSLKMAAPSESLDVDGVTEPSNTIFPPGFLAQNDENQNEIQGDNQNEIQGDNQNEIQGDNQNEIQGDSQNEIQGDIQNDIKNEIPTEVPTPKNATVLPALQRVRDLLHTTVRGVFETLGNLLESNEVLRRYIVPGFRNLQATVTNTIDRISDTVNGGLTVAATQAVRFIRGGLNTIRIAVQSVDSSLGGAIQNATTALDKVPIPEITQ